MQLSTFCGVRATYYGCSLHFDDVQLMVDTGLEAYKFSILWSRLIPGGRGPVNPKGLQFYNNYIDELISHGHIYITIPTFRNFSTFCRLHIIAIFEKQHTKLPSKLKKSFISFNVARIQPHITLFSQ